MAKHTQIKNVFALSLVGLLLVVLPQTTLAETMSIQACQINDKKDSLRIFTVKSVQIGLNVYGPGINEQKLVHIIPNSTVCQVLHSYYRIIQKKVCCNSTDIWAINGVETVPGESFWVIKVNGNSQNYSSQSSLTEGDVLELVYMKKAQYVEHQYLSKWLSEEEK